MENLVKERESMNGFRIFDNKEKGFHIRTILNPDGSISVNAEDTAAGFGWTQDKSGKNLCALGNTKRLL